MFQRPSQFNRPNRGNMEIPDIFEILVDGQAMKAKRGQTLAEVLIQNGLRKFRETLSGAPRGAFCGVGICYECRMTVNGRPNVRTCVTPAFPDCQVSTLADHALEVPDD